MPSQRILGKLKDDGTIETRLFEWAEELRTLGNVAAHGVDSVISPEDARDTLEFTEALLEYFLRIEISLRGSSSAELKYCPRERKSCREVQKVAVEWAHPYRPLAWR